VDSIEATLGKALLVAAGLAVILLLLEANFILRLTGRLTKSLRPDDRASGEPVTKEEED
jgi:hypothetical protein